jgi:hypothetical protein
VSSRDTASKAHLAIMGRDELLDVADCRLRFYHEEIATSWLERQDVDRAPLTEDAERRFGKGDPAVRLEAADKALDHRGVGLVEQSIGDLAPVDDLNPHGRAERPRNCVKRPERNMVDEAAFDPRDRRLRRPRPKAQVCLTQAPMDADRPDRPPDPDPVHSVTW